MRHFCLFKGGGDTTLPHRAAAPIKVDAERSRRFGKLQRGLVRSEKQEGQGRTLKCHEKGVPFSVIQRLSSMEELAFW